MPTILVVDDEKKIRNIIRLLLKSENYDVLTAESGEEAVLISTKNNIDIALLDLNLPGMDGLETMKKLKELHKSIQYVFITAHGDIKTAVEAIKLGSYNFISKPFDNDELLGILSGVVKVKSMSDKIDELEKRLLSGNDPLNDIIGSSKNYKAQKD